MAEPIVIDMPKAGEKPANTVEHMTTTWTFAYDVTNPLTKTEFVELVAGLFKQIRTDLPKHMANELQKRNLLDMATFKQASTGGDGNGDGRGART